MGSSTYPRGDLTRSSIWECVARCRVLLACGTLVVERPLESSFLETGGQTSVAAWEVASTMSLASSTWVWRALLVLVGGRRAPGCDLGAERSDHAGGCRA